MDLLTQDQMILDLNLQEIRQLHMVRITVEYCRYQKELKAMVYQKKSM